MSFLQKIIENKTSVMPKTENSSNSAVVFLLIDVSASMWGDNLLQVKNGAMEFTRSAIKKGYQVGVISFDSYALYVQKPVSDIDLLKSSINALEVGGTTNMHEALVMADEKFRDIRPKIATVVVATDGMPDDQRRALEQASKLKLCNVSIITIGTDDADLAFLSQIASDEDLADVVDSKDLAKSISEASDKLKLPGSND